MRICHDPATVVFAAKADSLGLTDFTDLPEPQKQERRALAADWLERAEDRDPPDAKVQALINAAGLAPDDPEPWLELAEIWRWIGDYLRATDCLEHAAAAYRAIAGDPAFADRGYDYRRNVALRTALARAWLHYDRAEWDQGLDWATAAVRLEPGDDETMQINGLLKGAWGHWSHAQEISRDIRRRDEEDSDATWVAAVSEIGLGRFAEAFQMMLSLRPDREHAAECWRDKGAVAERLREWSYAVRWYQESAAALPLTDKSCLSVVRFAVLDPRAPEAGLPVWLAFDRYYVTGSLSAYAALALKNFDGHAAGPERDFWAGAVVNATGICLRRHVDEPWALRARGLVFAATGMPDLGIADLTRAGQLLASTGGADPRITAALGHMLLLKEDYRTALPYLQDAVDRSQNDAGAWSDLGLALIMTGETEAAETALTRAIDLDPRLPSAWYNRGLMYVHAGDYKQAERDLREAARLAPGNPELARLLQQTRSLRQRQEAEAR